MPGGHVRVLWAELPATAGAQYANDQKQHTTALPTDKAQNRDAEGGAPVLLLEQARAVGCAEAAGAVDHPDDGEDEAEADRGRDQDPRAAQGVQRAAEGWTQGFLLATAKVCKTLGG